MNDVEDDNRYRNFKLVTRMVRVGESLEMKSSHQACWRCYIFGIYVKEGDLYEKMINNRSKGEMRNWSASSLDVAVNREKQNKGASLYQQKRETWYKEGDMEWQQVFFLAYKYDGN